MASIRILGKNYPRNAPNYRGTDRVLPYHCDELPDEHEANKAFFWFIEEGGELGVVHDLSKAKWLVETYSHLSPPQEFEIVEAIKGPGPGKYGGCFLGVDLSVAFNYSVLGWGLNFSQFGATAESDDPILRRISPLITLVESYFKPKLNRNGLFDAFADAVQCRDCMMALQEIHPNLWEHDESSDFQPVSLYRIQT